MKLQPRTERAPGFNPALVATTKLRASIGALNPKNNDPDDLVTRRAAAGIIGVSTETLKRWGRAGRLPTHRLSSRCIRYRLGDIQKLVAEARCVGGTTAK